jgi:hypothetical protein
VVLERASLVAGHLGLEALEYLPDGTVTAAFIRNPVERVLSHYAHVRRDPALSGEARDLSLEEFVHSPRWAPYAANFQAHNLVQRIGLRSIWRDRSAASLLEALAPELRPPDPELPVQTAFELLGAGRDGADLERRALAELEKVRHVSTSDNLQILYAELTRYWGVTDPPELLRSNVGANRLERSDVPETLVREISDANPVDWALYEQAGSRTAVPRASQPSPSRVTPLPDSPPGPTPPPEPTVGPRSRRPGTLVLATASTAAVAALDAFIVQGIALMSLLVIGPCLALLGGRWRPVAVTGAVSLAAAVALSDPDGVWWTSDQLAVLLVVTLVSGFATAAGFISETGRLPSRKLGPPLARP